MSLKKLRERIDHIDQEILSKLNRRMELTLQTKKFKSKTYDRNREIQVLGKVREHAQRLSLISSEFAEKIFTETIRECRRLQIEEEK